MSQFVVDKKINLNGVDYTLKFNFKTILNFEKATGKNFFRLGGEFSGTDLITLLWAMLVAGGHTIDVDQTAEIVDFSNIGEINTAINELVKSGMPEDADNAHRDGSADSLGDNPPLEEKLQK
jgi:hypothetical protein